MTDVNVSSGFKQITVSVIVTRCGCAPRDWQLIHVQNADGSLQPCPNPLRVEDRGVIAYWHRNRFRRLFARLAGHGRVHLGGSSWRTY